MKKYLSDQNIMWNINFHRQTGTDKYFQVFLELII